MFLFNHLRFTFSSWTSCHIDSKEISTHLRWWQQTTTSASGQWVGWKLGLGQILTRNALLNSILVECCHISFILAKTICVVCVGYFAVKVSPAKQDIVSQATSFGAWCEHDRNLQMEAKTPASCSHASTCLNCEHRTQSLTRSHVAFSCHCSCNWSWCEWSFAKEDVLGA